MAQELRKIIKLIGLVKERSAIYNFNLVEHSNRDYVNELWDEIANEMQAPVKNCKRKWLSLRNAFSRQMRNESNVDAFGKTARRKWYLSDHLAFLCEFNYYKRRGEKKLKKPKGPGRKRIALSYEDESGEDSNALNIEDDKTNLGLAVQDSNSTTNDFSSTSTLGIKIKLDAFGSPAAADKALREAFAAPLKTNLGLAVQDSNLGLAVQDSNSTTNDFSSTSALGIKIKLDAFSSPAAADKALREAFAAPPAVNEMVEILKKSTPPPGPLSSPARSPSPSRSPSPPSHYPTQPVRYRTPPPQYPTPPLLYPTPPPRSSSPQRSPSPPTRSPSPPPHSPCASTRSLSPSTPARSPSPPPRRSSSSLAPPSPKRCRFDDSDYDDTSMAFFRSILPDIIKLSNRRQRLFKAEIILKLNRFLDSQETECVV